MRSLKLISFLFLVISVITWNINAQAQDGEWGPRFTINPDDTPLEISGGNVIPGWDTYVILNEESVDPMVKTNGYVKGLVVYNINEFNPNVVNTSFIPFNGQVFALSHRLVNTQAGNNFFGPQISHLSFVEDSMLKHSSTIDGNQWNTNVISNNPFYGSSDLAVDPLQPQILYAGGQNFNNNSYDIFQSLDGGQIWLFVNSIFGQGGNLVGMMQGGTRCTFDVFGGQVVVCCGQFVNNQLQLFVNRGNGNEVIDTDVFPSNVPKRDGVMLKIAENNSPLPKHRTLFNYAYFHEQSGMVKDAIFMPAQQQQQQGPIVVQPVGAAPNTINSFGIGMSEGPPGTADVMYPGNHFQVTPNAFDQDAQNIFVTDVNPYPVIGTDGPIGTTGMEIPATSTLPDDFDDGDFQEPKEYMFSVGFRFSYDYAAFRGIIPPRPIPTLSQWGLIALAGVLMLSGAFYLRRKKVMS